MAVAPLPSSTTRLLGSSVVITDPISLVKELIDNSVDASATSIEVLVSPNTVDKIQVRDNGYGVSFEDFDFLGRRAHTSKLRNFEELEARGGETLGFRGDALASANSLATVKITTKTAQDPIATLIWLKPGNGGVEKEQPVSAPIGTMVQVLKLFENLPVRKQNAMKESRKSLSGIKRLLETYALAMPRLKLSFKVIGEPNQTWSYSPSSRATPREAVAQVFGNAVITQCVEKAVSLTSGSTEKPQRPAWGTLTAILPRQGCQLASIKGRGSFISVGSRPILSTRGTGKRLATIFKESLTGSLGQTQRTRSVTSPFMRLNITCNPRSYDASISPLKDEVIFKDEQAILDCFRDLCDCVYKSEGSDSDKDGRSYPSSSTAGNTNTIQLLTMRQLEKPASDPEHGSSPQAILNSANEFHDLGEEVVVDDLDLLEAMDKAEHDKQLGPSESSFEATHRVGARARQELTHTQVNAEKPDETGSSTTLAMMRTVINVNLARRESNTSDEGFTTGLFPVQVTPRRTASPATNHTTSCPADKDSGPIRRQRTIRQYFQRQNDQPIEIALDETATSGNLQSQEESNLRETTRQHQIGRQPLKELTSSVLNMMREEEEEDGQAISLGSDSDFSSPEPNILRAPHAPRGDIDISLPRQGQHIIAEAVGIGPNRQRPTTLNPGRNTLETASGRERRDQRDHISLQTGGFNGPQTPPPSNPMRSERIFSSHRGRGEHLAGDQGNLELRASQAEGMAAGDHLGQTSVSTRDGLPRNVPQLRPPRNGISLLGRRYLARPSREMPSERPRTPICNNNGAEYHGDNEFPDQASRTSAPDQLDGFFQAASQHPDMQTTMRSTGIHSSSQGAHWSHLSQALLMRTPPPPSGSDDLNNRRDKEGFQNDLIQARMCDTPFSEVHRSKRRCSRTQSEISMREEQDPRRYYMKGRSMRTRSGRPRRLPSMMLPLEKIPSRQETQQLSATIGGGLSSLRMSAWEYMTVDEIDSPLLFRDMEEALSVENRLKKAVNSWLNGKEETIVEYTMQSVAKGKQKA